MPRETKPSLVYLVKGEGVRDNSWVVQRPPAPIEYSNPPVEQLDSVLTPFGADLSIRIFEKETNPVPDFYSSNPATDVYAVEAAPMDVPSTQTPSSVQQPRPDPPPPSRPSAPSVGSRPSAIPSAPSSNPTSAPALSKPPQVAPREPSRFSVDPRRLRNFRNLSVPIIADPRTMPPPYFLTVPSSPPSQSHALPKPSQTSAKKASEQSVRKISTPTAATLPKAMPTAPQERVRTSPVRSAHTKTPQATPLSLPGPALLQKAAALQAIAVTSPSAFGRWKTSSPVSPSGPKSPQLPQPTKQKPTAADKSRLKPWQKAKAVKPSPSAVASHEKALQDIVAKRMKTLPRPSKTLPPLTPLAPPATHPIKPPAQTKPIATVMLRDLGSEQVSPRRTMEVADQPAEHSKMAQASVMQPSRQPLRQLSKQPATADGHHARKKDTIEVGPNTPGRESTSPEKALSTKATPLVPGSDAPVTSAQKLPQSVPSGSNKPVAKSMPSPERSRPTIRDVAVKPPERLSKKPTANTKTTIRDLPMEQPDEITPSPPPQTSIDEIEVGTAARPILTKEDQIKARRLRESIGQSKARLTQKTAPKKVPPSSDRIEKHVASSKLPANQESGSVPEAASKADATHPTARRDSVGLFDSEVQKSMKSVIEQVVWTVQHYQRRYGISHREEMKNDKGKILDFIHLHLDDPASGSGHSPLAKQQPAHLERGDQDATRARQAYPKGIDSARRTSDSRHRVLKSVKAHRMFVAWKRDIQAGGRSFKQIAAEAEQLRQTVLQCDQSIIHFSAKELVSRLKELSELTYTFQELKKRLPKSKSEIDLLKAALDRAKEKNGTNKTNDDQSESEFAHVFNIIKCAVWWVFFLEEQVTQTWKSFMDSSKAQALEFARDVYKVLIKESHKTDSSKPSDANERFIMSMRTLKSRIGKIEGFLTPSDSEKPVSLTLQEIVRKFADICKFGEEKTETKAAPPGPGPGPGPGSGSDRGAPSTSLRPDSTIRRSSISKVNGNQQSRHPPRGAPASTGTPRVQNSSKFESVSRGKTAVLYEPTGGSNSKSPLAIPRRPSEPVPPRSNQAGVNSRTPTTTPANVSRWQNADRPDLRSLMASARKVHDPKQKGAALLGNKRRADECRNSPESDGKPSKKRRVKFATNLVQGAQSTPYSKEALQSLFFDGYDLLGNTSALQKAAVEERASQMSRGSVIAAFGFIRSYVAALKAARDGENCERPEWVSLPYTVAMKKDIQRFMERFRNGSPDAHPPP